MPSQPFSGKAAVVTGASSGIGRALAIALAQQGADVAMIARSKDKLQALSEELTAFPGRRLVCPAECPSGPRRVPQRRHRP